MNRIKHIAISLLFFCYIYNFNLFFIPFSLKTRMLIGALGAGGMLLTTTGQQCQRIGKVTGTIVGFCFSLLVVAILSIAINFQSDYWLIQFVVLTIIYLIASKYSAQKICKVANYDIYKVYRWFVYLILLHNVVAFLGLLIPGLMSVIIEIQGVDRVFNQYMIDSRLRSYGLGEGQFFVGGLISGFGLILLAYLMKMNKVSTWRGFVLYILVLITGIFIARTTIVGIICSLVFLIPNKKPTFKIRGKNIIFLIITLMVITSATKVVLQNDVVDTSWAFNFFEEGTKDPSLQDLKRHYKYPESRKTWLIGDAFFMDPKGRGYYMHTDVGWLRIIFCGGLLALFVYIAFHSYIANMIIKKGQNSRNDSLLAVAFMVLLLAGSMKGFTNLLPYMFLLLMSQIECQKNINNKNESYTHCI